MSEVTVDSLSHLPLDPKDHGFDLVPGAIEQAECSRFERAEPEYQKDYFLLRSDSKAEDQHVVLAGRLDEKGRAGDVLIQQPGTELADNLALRAVKEIHFKPAKCDHKAVPSLFRLFIWFAPEFHMDGFDSFR